MGPSGDGPPGSRDQKVSRMGLEQQARPGSGRNFAAERLAVVLTFPLVDSASNDRKMTRQELLAKLGLPIGEVRQLTSLVAHLRSVRRWIALVSTKPLNLTGGTGSVANAPPSADTLPQGSGCRTGRPFHPATAAPPCAHRRRAQGQLTHDVHRSTASRRNGQGLSVGGAVCTGKMPSASRDIFHHRDADVNGPATVHAEALVKPLA